MISLFSYFIIAIYSGCIVKSVYKKRKLKDIFISCLTITCCIEANNLSGFFLKFKNGFELEYSEFGIAVTLIIGIIILFNKDVKIAKKYAVSVFLFFSAVFIGILLEILFPSKALIISYSNSWDVYMYGYSNMTRPIINTQSLLIFFRCIIIIIFLTNLKIGNYSRNDYNNIVAYIINAVKIHILFCLFEFISKNLFHSPVASNLQSLILGVGRSTYIGVLMRGNNAMIQGLTRETSSLSFTLYLFVCLLILTNKINKNKLWIALTLLLLVLSGSFASIMYFCVIIVAYLFYYTQIYKRKSNNIIYIFALGITAILISCLIMNNTYLLNRLNNTYEIINAILNNGNVSRLSISSELVRNYSIYYTLKTVLSNRPAFGFGIGTCNVHGGLVCVIGQIGLIGFFAWINLIKNFAKDYMYSTKNMILFFIIYILSNLFVGGINMLYATYLIPLLYVCSRNYNEIS